MHASRLNLLLSSLGIFVAFAGCREYSRPIAIEAKAEAGESVAKIATSYASYRKMTPKPVYVNAGLASLCRGASSSDLEKLRPTYGPHTNTQVLIYMNDAAAEALSAGQPSYPPGSVIVKQKTLMEYYDEATKKWVRSHPAGVGGMVKRAPSYDAEHGDWEYFYFEDPAKIESGKIATCVDCHQNAKARDYVYGSWSKTSQGVKKY